MSGLKKTLLALTLAFLGSMAISAGVFDPEKDVAVVLKDGSVVLNVPYVAHASEISIKLKAGTKGDLIMGRMPPPAGVDALGIDYWTGPVKIPVKGEGLTGSVTLLVSFMSCEEGDGGMCFPPTTLELVARASEIPGTAAAAPKTAAPDRGVGGIATGSRPEAPSSPSGTPTVPTAVPEALPSTDSGSPQQPSWAGLITMLVLFFLGGIGASLTPCVLPMIPITMAVIGAKGGDKAKGLLLGLVLTQGMALTYTVLGVAAALTGSVFGQFAQRPAFLIPVSLIFALFAVSLLGAFEFKLPDSLAERLQGSRPRGGLLGAFVAGLMLGPLSAPCVGPLIGAAIVDIGANQRVLEGALKMFVFAQGMGLLFIAGGVAVSALPRSGDWLIRFKQALGVVVMAFAVWNIRLIAPEWLNHAMWAAVLLLASGAFGAFEAAGGLMGNVRKGLALFAFALAALLGVRATEMVLNMRLLPIGAAAVAGSEGGPTDGLWIEHDFELALSQAKSENKLVLVDTFTSWCAQCKELDEKTWPDPTVVGWIQKNAVAVRIDTEKARPDLAKPLGIAAYPTTILMDGEGNELGRLNGFHRPERMHAWLKGTAGQ